jgi:hypothetical protein
VTFGDYMLGVITLYISAIAHRMGVSKGELIGMWAGATILYFLSLVSL